MYTVFFILQLYYDVLFHINTSVNFKLKQLLDIINFFVLNCSKDTDSCFLLFILYFKLIYNNYLLLNRHI